jgi:hypothetical protein
MRRSTTGTAIACCMALPGRTAVTDSMYDAILRCARHCELKPSYGYSDDRLYSGPIAERSCQASSVRDYRSFPDAGVICI